MEAKIPIVFIHCGHADYLACAVGRAAKCNPGSKIVLIGDEAAFSAVRHLTAVKCVPVQALVTPESRRFRDVYVHMYPTDSDRVLFWTLRWFYLSEYLKKESSDFAFHYDSDVLLYSSAGEMAQAFSLHTAKCGLCIPDQEHETYFWAASAHVSFWTAATLRDFCEFAIASYSDPTLSELYTQKYDYHRRSRVKGGVCDMTTLYLFARRQSQAVANLLIPSNGMVVDNNVNSQSNYYSTKEYKWDKWRSMKRVFFRNERAILSFEDAQKGTVRAAALHFQGIAKKRMRGFAKASNIDVLIPPLGDVWQTLKALSRKK